MNLLLIDSEIPGLDIFMKSCNTKTKFIVYNTKLVTFQMLDKKIATLNISRYNNLGFVFVNDYNIEKLFVDSNPFISYNQDGILDNLSTSYITYLIKKYQIKTIDFLACNLLGQRIWKNYFDYIAIKNNVKVRASDDLTGNLSSGGDWILESTGENVETLYFNGNIKYWNYLLDTGPDSQSTFVISADNSNNLYSCGDNSIGQLGLGDLISRNTFQIVSNFSTNISNKKVVSIVSGASFSLLITSESTNNLYSCGNNSSGQLGLGITGNSSTFQNVTSGINAKKIISISSGNSHSLLLTNELTNNLYACGNNASGQLGLGDTTNRNTFQNITSGISGKKIKNINCGNNYSFILTDDTINNLYSCGNNTTSQLGLNDTTNRNTFQNVTSGIFGKKVLTASGGGGQSLILTNDISNNLYGCGDTSYGKLGTGVYPVAFMTANTTIISGQPYGNGTYDATASSTTSTNSPFRAFDSDIYNTYWRSGSGGYNSSGVYTGAVSTSTTSGNILGEWLQLQLPPSLSIVLGGFFLSTRSTNIMKPKGVTVLGSNNTFTPWNILYVTSSVGLFPPDEVNIYLNPLPSIAYRFYRIVVTSVVGGAGYTEISTWNLYESIRTFQNIPTIIQGKPYTNVSAGGNHSLLLSNDSSNNLYASGLNSSGQLGNGTNTNSTSFKQTSNTLINNYYNGISSGSNFSLVTTSDPINNLYVTGNNTSGQLNLNNNTNINILRNTTNNILRKKIVLNRLTNSEMPITNTFFTFTYGTDNITYYSTAQDDNNNLISIRSIFNPESLFPTLKDTIGEAYLISSLGTSFASVVSFTFNFKYLSNVYYQYNINSDLLKMGTDSTKLPYYTYEGIYLYGEPIVTIYTNILFTYLVLTTPPTNSGAQFSNLKNLVINAVDNPLILPNTRLNCSFFNTPSVSGDISGWDVSSSITMSSMFRDSSFNNELFTWKPNKVKDMSYMFYGANNFNKKLSYDPSNQTWDVSGVTNMSYIFNTSTSFNNSQLDMSGTEPMNWILNPNVNITNDVSYSALTVANAQTLIPDLLVYLNIGIASTTEASTGSTLPYKLNFYNEDGTIGISNETINNTSNTIFGSRYNIAGDALWSVKINVPSVSPLPGPNQGSIASDLSRNVIMSGRWYNNYGPCIFYDSNDVSNSSLVLPWGGNINSEQNGFIVKYNTNGIAQWRNRICFSTPSASHRISNTCCDISGNIYSTGRFRGQAQFQNSNLSTWVDISSVGLTTDGFLAKYNQDGSGIWFSRISSNNYEESYQTIVDRNNNSYCVGYHDLSGTQIYSGVLNGFGTLSKTVPYSGIWFTKYDPNGNILWSTDFSGNIYPSKLGYGLSYNIYVGGYYSNTPPVFRNSDNSVFTTLRDISAANAYVAKYNSDGFGSWTSRISTDLDPLYVNITGICDEKQFLDISYPQQGLRFGIYNGYFDTFPSNKYSFFYSNYPYATGITSNFTNISTSTNGLFISGDYISVCWWGFFRAKKTGTYTFSTTSDDASYLMINGNQIVNNGGEHASQTRTGTCNLVAGTYYYIQIFYGQSSGGLAFSANYTEPGGVATPNATGLNTYFVAPGNSNGMYDNWINQTTYTLTNATSLIKNENYFSINTTGSDPQISMTGRPAINPYIYKYIHIKYRISSITSGSTPYRMSIYYGNSTFPLSESRRVDYTYPMPISNILGTWQNAVIDMTNQINWYTDNWSEWRLDPISDGIANIQFEYFFVTDTPILPLNETGNNVYVTCFSKGNNTNIYNSSFYYDTSTNFGYSDVSNSFFKSYTSNNTFEQSYIIKYNLNGQCVWSILLDGALNVRTTSIRTDKTGYVYVFGQFGTSLRIRDKNGTICATYTTSIENRYDTFIAAYSSDGNYQWSTRQESIENDYAISYGPAVTATTNAYFGDALAMS